MNKSNNLLFVVLSALLVGLSQHNIYCGVFSWFGFVPFLHVLKTEKQFKKLLIFSLIWGFLYNLVVIFWLSMNVGTNVVVAFITMLLSVLIMSFNSVFVLLLWHRIKKFFFKDSLILFPIIWVTVEFLRSYGLLGFPWISIANSQLDYLYLIQNAELVGIYGISFWVLSINVLLYNLFINKYEFKKVAYVFSFIILPWISGYYLYLSVNDSYENSILEVALIQPNVNLESKRNINLKYDNLENLIINSREAVKDNSKLIVWPESAVPFHRLQFSSQRKEIVERVLSDNDSYILSGNIIKQNLDVFNSSILFNKEKVVDVYNKRLPVPLAEHVPLSSVFPSLKYLNIGSSNFSKGKNDVVYEIDDFKFSSLICFESTFPDINRRHVKKGADALIYLVNDGWYETEPQPTQHARQSIFRAIENRKPVLRCANTGISMFINERGEVENTIALNEFGTMKVTLKKNSNNTFYTRFGNVFALILLIISGVFLLITFIKNEKD